MDELLGHEKHARADAAEDIANQFRDQYDVDISAEFIVKVTDRLLPEMSE